MLCCLGVIQNAVGKPVQGDDFFDRKREVEEIWSRLQTDDILLLAPRRVGKTSLMFRLREDAAAHQRHALYVSVADATTELAFARKLLAEIGKQDSNKDVLKVLTKSPVAKFLGKVKKFGVASVFEFELKDDAEAHWATIGEAIVVALAATGSKWLILVDELPIFVLALLRADASGNRARDFLNWFRTRRMGLGDTINDLYLYSDFGAFTRDTAFALLGELAKSYSMTLADDVKGHICGRMGWLIPFHLQMCFADLSARCPRGTPTLADVDAVYDNLLSPAKKTYFDFWRQRLQEELGQPDDGRAIRILNAIAKDDEGATRQTLSGVLSADLADAVAREQQLLYLTDTLVSDGYVVMLGERYQFRSALLRDYWRRNVV
jgi:hypothetical protein